MSIAESICSDHPKQTVSTNSCGTPWPCTAVRPVAAPNQRATRPAPDRSIQIRDHRSLPKKNPHATGPAGQGSPLAEQRLRGGAAWTSRAFLVARLYRCRANRRSKAPKTWHAAPETRPDPLTGTGSQAMSHSPPKHPNPTIRTKLASVEQLFDHLAKAPQPRFAGLASVPPISDPRSANADCVKIVQRLHALPPV